MSYPGSGARYDKQPPASPSQGTPYDTVTYSPPPWVDPPWREPRGEEITLGLIDYDYLDEPPASVSPTALDMNAYLLGSWEKDFVEGDFRDDPEGLYDHPYFQSVFREIFDESFNLLVERQRKYGPENIRELGIFGVFSRLASDKIERIRRSLSGYIKHGEITLYPSDDFTDESLEDALFDIANYALIMIALNRGKWGAPLEEDL